MLTLAAMIWAAWAYVATNLNMLHTVPMPVVIEHGNQYRYEEIYSAIYVPEDWTDSCYNQTQVVSEMIRHFNNFRNRNNKLTEDKMNTLARKWVCVQ